jgi:hypothetical protein
VTAAAATEQRYELKSMYSLVSDLNKKGNETGICPISIVINEYLF